MELTNNRVLHRYEIVVENATAYVDYVQTGSDVTLVHTFVPTALAGRGLGSTLARLVLEDIRNGGMKVVPKCEFISGFVKRHPAFEDLLANPIRTE
jgi:predicted GNAT family acetyltransferase